jgi:hypothetical protein
VLALGAVLTALAPPLLGFGGYSYLKARARWPTLPHVEAEVLETRRVRNYVGYDTFTRYHYAYGGRSVTTEARLDRGQPGDLVELIIDPSRPGRVVQGPSDLDSMATIPLGMGACSLGVGLMFVFFALQARREALSPGR